MIYAYAIEPEAVVAWTELNRYRLLVNQFGLGTPRVLLELPGLSVWEELVLAAAAVLGITELEWKRLDDLLEHLRERRARRRSARFDEEMTWLENAEVEHGCRPFGAYIVARGNPRKSKAVILDEHLGDPGDARWDKPVGITSERNPLALAEAVAAMLQNADKIHFVDRHFGPENLRHRRIMEAYLETMMAGRTTSPSKVALHCEEKSPKAFFETEAKKMARGIPVGAVLEFYRWEERPGGEKFHNRYLLTDIGGVTFGTGHEEGEPGESEDINIMGRDQYTKRWEQFFGVAPAFDLIDRPATITGTRTT
jgi:hypothetical protein